MNRPSDDVVPAALLANVYLFFWTPQQNMYYDILAYVANLSLLVQCLGSWWACADDPRRHQSLPTLITTILLTPVGIYTMLRMWIDPYQHLCIDQNPLYARESTKLFLAYITLDMIYAIRYYRTTFPLLAGWIHHLLIGAYALWCLREKQSVQFASTLVAETSSVLLAASQVFPTNATIRYQKKKLFPILFFVSRILVLGSIVIQAWRVRYIRSLLQPFLFALFTSLNLYWWTKMTRNYHR